MLIKDVSSSSLGLALGLSTARGREAHRDAKSLARLVPWALLLALLGAALVGSGLLIPELEPLTLGEDSLNSFLRHSLNGSVGLVHLVVPPSSIKGLPVKVIQTARARSEDVRAWDYWTVSLSRAKQSTDPIVVVVDARHGKRNHNATLPATLDWSQLSFSLVKELLGVLGIQRRQGEPARKALSSFLESDAAKTQTVAHSDLRALGILTGRFRAPHGPDHFVSQEINDLSSGSKSDRRWSSRVVPRLVFDLTQDHPVAYDRYLVLALVCVIVLAGGVALVVMGYRRITLDPWTVVASCVPRQECRFAGAFLDDLVPGMSPTEVFAKLHAQLNAPTKPHQCQWAAVNGTGASCFAAGWLFEGTVSSDARDQIRRHFPLGFVSLPITSISRVTSYNPRLTRDDGEFGVEWPVLRVGIVNTHDERFSDAAKQLQSMRKEVFGDKGIPLAAMASHDADEDDGLSTFLDAVRRFIDIPLPPGVSGEEAVEWVVDAIRRYEREVDLDVTQRFDMRQDVHVRDMFAALLPRATSVDESLIDRVLETQRSLDASSPEVVSDKACAVCFEDFSPGMKVVSWPCTGRHTFCVACFSECARSKNACPLCREAIDPAFRAPSESHDHMD
jgi:hypothetical protein